MLTRQEREQNVLSLYNQGKTIRDIAREVRISFRDIGVVLKKEQEKMEKEKQRTRFENNMTSTEGDNSRGTNSSSTQAYKLFSQGRTPVEVAIELDLNEKQVTKHYMECGKLKGLYKLNLVHDEIKDDIAYFAKLYRLSKAAGNTPEHVVRLLNIANNDLPALENKYKKLQRNVNELESKELDASITLEDLKSQIQNANQVLYSCHLSCQKEVRKILQLHRRNMRLNALLRQFKNSDEEYLKIRHTAEQAVLSTLSNNRRLLKFALFSLIESLRADPIRFNSLVDGTPSQLASKNHYSNASPYYSNQHGYAETLAEVIVDVAASLYEKMVKDFTNQAMSEAAGTSTKLLPSIRDSDKQTDHSQALLAYRYMMYTSVYER
jgi:hypothetical protein